MNMYFPLSPFISPRRSMAGTLAGTLSRESRKLNDILYIPVGHKGHLAKVSYQTAILLLGRNLHIHKNKKAKYHYPAYYFRKKLYKIHRVLLNAKSGELVDHKNGDTFDSTLANLRITDHRTNRYNTHTECRSNSKYFGVHIRKDRHLFRVIYSYNKRNHSVNVKNIIIAALLRDLFINSVTKERGQLNFPESIKSENLREFLECTNGRIFTVYYVKRNCGRLRKMNCRVAVSKYVNGKGLLFSPENNNLYLVYDMQIKSYRMINLEGVLAIIFAKKKYKIEYQRESITLYEN